MVMRGYFIFAFIIVMEVILRTVPTATEQTCNNLADRYYHQATALADSAYTFLWATASGAYVPTKMAVGSVQFVVEYDAANDKFVIAGPCSNTDWSAFQVQDKTLHYQKDGFAFEAQCFSENGGPLKLKVLPRSNTSIEAFR